MTLIFCGWLRIEVNEDVSTFIYQYEKDSSRTVNFSDVQIVRKFTGECPPNLDFKVTVFLQPNIS